MNPNPQTIAIIAEQRRTELMHDAAQQRLARVAKVASSSTSTLKWPARLSRCSGPMQVGAHIPRVGRVRRPGRSRQANTTTAA